MFFQRPVFCLLLCSIIHLCCSSCPHQVRLSYHLLWSVTQASVLLPPPSFPKAALAFDGKTSVSRHPSWANHSASALPPPRFPVNHEQLTLLWITAWSSMATSSPLVILLPRHQEGDGCGPAFPFSYFSCTSSFPNTIKFGSMTDEYSLS